MLCCPPIGKGRIRVAAAVKLKNGWRKFARIAVKLPSVLKIPSFVRRVERAATFPVFKSSSWPALNRKPSQNPHVITADTWIQVRSEINLKRPDPKSLKCKTAATQSPLSDINCAPLLEGLACASCPCPCPCGPCGPCAPCGSCGPCGPCYGNMTDCNCARLLPPPCNTPPRCIQYMQGYYYYPYGTWFCGPYHVNTGGVPIAGPVCPGTACGIAPPNPNLLCRCPCGPCTCGVLGSTLCPDFGGPLRQSTSNPCIAGPHLGTPIPQGFRPQSGIWGMPLGACLVPDTPNSDVSSPAIPKISQTTQLRANIANPPTTKPIIPKWMDVHGPCQCAECQASKAANFLNKPIESRSYPDTKTAWRGVNADLFQKAAVKEQKQQTVVIQERPNYCEMLRDPKTGR